MSIFSIFKKNPVLVVHNGTFHADDIFATAVLNILLDGNLKVIRTREQSAIDKADYVADVGGIYDIETKRFDHHQKGGAGVRQNGIPYAAFGLVWKQYGAQICGSQKVADLIDDKLVAPIDADDNGYSIGEFSGKIYPRAFQSFFYVHRPTWKEDSSMFDKSFLMLVPEAEKFLRREIIQTKDFLESEDAVEQAYQNSADKRLIILDKQYPFQDVLTKHEEPLYVVIQKKSNTDWVVETVRIEPKNFANRKDLPSNWAGLKDSELAKETGVPDAVFCHNGRWLAVAKSKEGALALAQKALLN
jgi:uncharacterized UPF0160 family protein